jgi:hypothetical protein
MIFLEGQAGEISLALLQIDADNYGEQERRKPVIDEADYSGREFK